MSVLIKKYLNSISIILLLLQIQACSTLPSYIDIQLPAYASSIFADCSSLNGALRFQFYREGNSIEPIDMEWAAKPSGDWGIASYSPIGQTLLLIKFSKDRQNFESSGYKTEWLSDLSVSPKGFLRYSGQKLGLRPDEFPCLWSGILPRNWLRQVLAVSQDVSGMLIRIQDEERNILVRVAKHGSDLPWTWQADINWDLYWGLDRRSLHIESGRNKNVSLSSETMKNLECRWFPKDED
ncbi:MAG: hypothetical protein NTX25_02840 [Proteobacteria bacterium]|nr:hypothetical protein [Pseudomonadota bacterium]